MLGGGTIPLKLEPYKEDILQRYSEGWSLGQIAKHYNEYLQPVQNLVRKYGSIRPKVAYDIDASYFASIEREDQAYFLGFIAADGAIVNNLNKDPALNNTAGSMVLTISIHRKDRSILESMKTCMQSTHPIVDLARDQVRLVIGSKQMAQDLAQYGVGQRKSLTLEPMLQYLPEHLKRHFIRGYFDGDGSVFLSHTGRPGNYKERHYVSIRGTEGFLQEFQAYLGIQGGLAFNNGTHQWRFGAKKDVLAFRDIIYSNAQYYLPRKYERFPW